MTDPFRPPMLAAAVAGFPAYVIAKVLEDALPARLVALQRQAERGHLHPQLLDDVTVQWASIREAGRQWADYRSAADGSAAELLTAAPPSSNEIDTGRAAALLGVTPNRVRQLIRSGLVPGRKQARAWLVDRTAIELRKGTNSGHFR